MPLFLQRKTPGGLFLVTIEALPVGRFVLATDAAREAKALSELLTEAAATALQIALAALDEMPTPPDRRPS